MRILHTADLHLGQIIYQNYDRSDEHRHFFNQLKRWCLEERPDALVVCGDIYDIQQPSASTKKAFTEYFVDIHRTCPDMRIVVIAGNHDSASRVQADSAVWELANTKLIGIPPAKEASESSLENFIVRLESGYILAMPYMTAERQDMLQQLLDKVEAENSEGKPVVMLGHTAVTGVDVTGHNIEIGKLKTQNTASFGTGFDYLALGHIHKPQTIGHQEDCLKENAVRYPSPVIRYSGSALHVSCDETYPHSVSIVDIDRHGGEVVVRPLRINELRHFYVLPLDGKSFTGSDEALAAIGAFCDKYRSGYIRLQVDYKTNLPTNFNQMVYDMLALTNDEVRYNPKIIWTGKPDDNVGEKPKPTFEVAELQQMKDPLQFIEKTKDQYPSLDMDEIREAFKEVEKEIRRMNEEESLKAAAKTKKKKGAGSGNENNEEGEK